MQLEHERQVMRLEVENQTSAQRLQSYEELEKEMQQLLDQVVEGKKLM